jgi:6-pyruvoyl-tetrahydropterin synthase
MPTKDDEAMYSVTVRDHIMIAHSLRGEVFGPAQQLHGATYTVDVEFRRRQLDEHGIVIDIGLALQCLHDVLQPLNYQNLDAMAGFQGVNTTTEVLARHIFEELRAHLLATPGVTVGHEALQAMKITLTESPNAWGSFEASLLEPGDA